MESRAAIRLNLGLSFVLRSPSGEGVKYSLTGMSAAPTPF